jgi:hypothetical protein
MWLTSRRSKRLEQFLEAERHEWRNIIERRRDTRQQKEREIDLALHREARESSNSLENREMRIAELTVADVRAMIADRIELRKRLASECEGLLSNQELSKLEQSMLESVRVARAARRGDYQRRAAAAGVPMLRPEQRDAGQYGDLEALVRREVRQLALGHSLGRTRGQGDWTREDKLKLAGLAGVLVALLALIVNIVGLERVRGWLGFGDEQRPPSTMSPPSHPTSAAPAQPKPGH